MALASIQGIPFRIMPNDIQWKYDIKTSVKNTLGGRVVQVLGAKMSNIIVSGQYGQDNSRGEDGNSAQLATDFVSRMRDLMAYQSQDANSGRAMQQPLKFIVPDLGYDFYVYLMDVQDQGGSSPLVHKTGKFSYAYTLTLFPVQDSYGNNPLADNQQNGELFKAKEAQAVSDAIGRISRGIGWKAHTKYNDPQRTT